MTKRLGNAMQGQVSTLVLLQISHLSRTVDIVPLLDIVQYAMAFTKKPFYIQKLAVLVFVLSCTTLIIMFYGDIISHVKFHNTESVFSGILPDTVPLHSQIQYSTRILSR